MDYEHFYVTHYNEAYRYVLKHIQNVHDAEDVLSNAFLYCYDHFSEYDPTRASERTWLYLVIKSRIRNYYRDMKEAEPLELLDEQPADKRDYLSEAAELQELREELAEALNTLPEKQRTLVILRYFYDCDTKEMAERTGMSLANVRTTLSRALDSLGKIMKSNGYGKEH